MKKTILWTVLLLGLASRTWAGTFTWNGSAGGDWSAPANWTPNGVPGPADTAIITNGSPVISAATNVGSVQLSGNTSLTANAALSVVSQFNWNGGSVAGQLIIASSASFNLNNPGSSLSLAGATIVNNGAAVWSGGTLDGDSSTLVTNNGSWIAASDDTFANPGGVGAAFYNNGAVIKSATTGMSTFSGVAFNNNGEVNVGSGTLTLAAGGSLGGSFTASNTAVINFSGGGLLKGVFTAQMGGGVNLTGGAFTNDEAVFIGPGATSMTGGTLLLTNDISSELLLAGGIVMLGPQFQQSGAITNLTIAGATLAGANTVVGTFNWTGGNVDGVLNVEPTGVVYLSGSEDLHLYAALTNSGTIIWDGSSNWHLDNTNGTGGWINNQPGGLIDAQCSQTIFADVGDEWFYNAGRFQKSMGTGPTKVQATFTNLGLVEVLTGSIDFFGGSFGGQFIATNGTGLNFEQGGVLGGSFNAGYGAVIDLAGGVFTANSVTFAGPGLAEQTGGTLTVNSPISNLQFNGGAVYLASGFEGGTITNLSLTNQTLEGTNTVTGTLTISGSSSSVTGPITVASGGVLNVSGASLTGPLVVAAGGIVNWSGSRTESPGAWVSIASNGVLNITGNFDASVTVTNAGTVNWDGGNFQLEDGAGFYNLAGAIFNIDLTQSEYFNNYYGSEFFDNAGLLEMSSPGSTVYFEPILTNSGTVSVQGGSIVFESPTSQSPLLGGVFQASSYATIEFTGGGLLDGSFDAATNGTINIAGNSSALYSYAPTVTFAGEGTNEITGGSITFASNVIPNLQLLGGTITLGPTFQGGSITNLSLANGTLLGTNILSGVLTINGGTLGPGQLLMQPASTLNFCGYLQETLTVPSNAVMNFTGKTTSYLYGSLTNQGTINWSNQDIYLENNVTFNNLQNAVFSCQGGLSFVTYDAGSAFNNAGLFEVSNTASTTYVDVPFNNLGSVYAYSGTLVIQTPNTFSGTFEAWPGGSIEFSGGGFLTGTYFALPGGQIDLSYGAFSNAPTATFTGGGSNLLTGGTITLTNNPLPDLQYQAGTVILSPQFQGGTITNLTLMGATLGGTNTVTGTLTLVTGPGEEFVTGSLTVASNGVLNITGIGYLYLDCALTNAGTINWLGSEIIMESSNDFQNLEGATFNIECDQEISLDYYPETPVFANAGAIIKSGSTGTTFFEMPLANAGVVNVQSGTLDLAEGGFLGGNFMTDAGAYLQLYSGSFTNLSGLTEFTGAGTNSLTGGSLYLLTNTIPGLELVGGTVYPGPDFQGGTITNLTLDGASLGGSNIVTGALTFAAYTYVQGPLGLAANSIFNCSGADFEGPLTIDSGAVLNVNGSQYDTYFNAPVTNLGTVNWSGGALVMASPFYNLTNAVLDVLCDAYSYGSSTIYNSGLIQKTNSMGQTVFYTSIANTGTVDAESGVFYFEEPLGLTGGLWEIGVNSINNYGSFSSQTAALLTNAFNINLRNGFQLAPGEVFTLVSYGSETGTFSSAAIEPPQGNNVTYNYGATALTLTVNSVNSPTISIVNPTNYQTFASGSTITIHVNYSDVDSVQQVQYYQGGTLIGTSSGTTFSWPNVSAGFYTLTARIIDNVGSIAVSAPINILVQRGNGVTYTWTGASSGNWSDNGDWQPAGVPSASDNAIIPGGPAVNLDGAFAVNSLILGGGTTAGAGSLLVTNEFNWCGGALNAALTVGANGSMYLNATSNLNASNATLVNLGTMLWTEGNLLGNVTTTISNAGAWVIQSSNNLFCAANFVNKGSISNAGASVSFTSGGVLLGSMSSALLASNILANGAFYGGAKASFAGPGSNQFTGGTLVLSNDASANLSLLGGTITLGPEFQAGGAITNLTLEGSELLGTNDVAGLLNLESGQISGQLNVEHGGILEFSGGEQQFMYLANLTLVNSGTVLWVNGDLNTDNLIVTNNNDWLIETSGYVTGGVSLFVNNGNLIQTNLPAFADTGFYAATLINNGTIDAETGTITISASGTPGGTYNAAAGAAIDFDTGNLTLGALPTITGAGTVASTGASLTILSNVPPGLELAGGAVTLGPAFQSNGVITNFTLNGATLAGNYAVGGSFNFESGTINGSLTIASNAALSITGPGSAYVINGGITNFGSVLWSNANIFALTAATFVNNNLWLAQSDNEITGEYNVATFINNGLFLKNGSDGDTLVYNTSFTNLGTVEAETGTILFDGGGTIQGTYNAASNATILFNGGLFTPVNAPVFAGPGMINFSGGTLVLTNDQIADLPLTGGNISFGPNFQNNGAITNLTLNGASLHGPVVVTGTLNWLSGGLYGPLTIASNGTLNFPVAAGNPSLITGSLTNFGTVNWLGGEIELNDQTYIVNNGLWLAQANEVIYPYYYYYYYSESIGFINNGIFRQPADAGQSYIEVGFTNNGLVDVESGTLYFDDGGQFDGSYNAAAGATIALLGGSFSNLVPATITGAGAVTLDGGSLTLMSDQIPGLQMSSGTLALGPNFQNNGAITNLTLSGASVTLQGANTVTGTFNWEAGNISGSLTVAANGLLNILSSANKYLAYDTFLNNSGTVAWTGGDLSGYTFSYTFITNNGLWLVQCDNTYLESVTFANAGTFRKNITSGATDIQYAQFINSGILDMESGLINFNTASEYAQTVATLEFGVSAPNLTGQMSVSGNVNLDGTLAVNLLNGYTPRLGDAITLMNYGSESGAFAQYALPPLAPGLNWDPEVGPSGVTLRVVPTISSQNTLTLSGSVTDNNHHPIQGVTVYATVASGSSSNLIHNGSFESPSIGGNGYVFYPVGSTNITGWTVIGPPGSDVDITSDNWNNTLAENGTQYFDPTGDYSDGGAGISQSFPTTPGTTYNLIFYHGTYSHQGINQALGVTIGNNYYTFGETSGGPGLGLDWRQVVIPFVASSNSTTLSFTSLTGGNTDDIFVDNVQVVAPDSDQLLEAVTDANGNYQINVANGTFAVNVAGLGAAGYNDVSGATVTMSGANQTQNFVATPLTMAATFTITTSASPLDAGATAGGGSATSGSAVTVTALATNTVIPYVFANWTENGVPVSLNADYTFVVSGNRNLVANFILPTYTISASDNPPTAGSVSGAMSAVWDSTVVLTATPAYGYAFADWTLGGTVVSANAVLSITVTNNQTYVANYMATNLSHVVTVATSPANVASIAGAGTYANGQTAVIKAPTLVTNGPDLYTFQYFTLNGSYASSSASLSVVMSTLQPPNLNYIAVYNEESLDPVLINVGANYANPVPETTNFILRFQFDRTMNTSVTPKIVLTNTALNAVQPVVGNNGLWTSTSALNDTYVTPPITFSPGMDGTVQVFVSVAQDPAGHKMTLTNAVTLTVRSTPPVVAISSPTNGASFTTTNTFDFAAAATSIYGVASVALYDNSSNLLANTASSNISFIVSNLAGGSYALTAVATDTTGLSATSAVVHVTINTPGTTLIDFEALNASAGPVSGAPLAGYLAGYGVSITNATSNTTVAVQDDQNFLGGKVTTASSGENLLTQIGANGAVSYTLVFNPPYPSVSWTRTELLAGSGGVETPAWQATAYDTNGVEVGSVGERQTGSFTNVPAKRFTLGGADIASITFAGNNSIGALATLPLDDLLLSTFAPGASISIALADTGSTLSAPGQIELAAQASDSAGSIVEIDFYEGQTLLDSVLAGEGGPLTQASFSLTNIAAGAYTFTAVATDNNGAVRSSTALPVTVSAVAGVNVINFDSLPTASGAVGGALLSNYLAGFGVKVDNLTLGTRVEAVNGNNLSGNAVAVPSSPPNLFTQVGLNQPITFTLELGAPVDSFSFTRVALTVGQAGISHPAWSAHAFNAAGAEVESVSEPLIFSFADVPARTFQLTGSGITHVRFDSDSEQIAAFSAVLLDDLVLDTNATASAFSVTLNQPSGSLTSPANLQLSATVIDDLGTDSSISFFSGPNLIGTVPGSSPNITWSNVLAGTYVLTAQAFDSSGYARISSPLTVTVNPGPGNSTLINFDSLNASTGPVTGAALSNYLSGLGVTLGGVTPGTQVAVENQAVLAGGGLVAASSPPNLLTQIGGNGPANFTVQFSNGLTSFIFTRPELLANPFVTHPAWQATAFDALGAPLAQAGEGLISSFTNVAAQVFVLQGSGGAIAGVEFSSQGSSLTTFKAALLDDFILTTNPTNLPPSVLLTNPLPGQIFTTPALIQVAAEAVDARSTIAGVAFYTNGVLIGSSSLSPYYVDWNFQTPGNYALTAVATDSLGLSRTSPPVNITVNPAPLQFGIITQPVGATVATGGSVIFSVQTTGTNTVTYQWDLNGNPLPGQTESVLSLTGVNNNSTGTYTVTATSGGQSITSQSAVLAVLDPPTITTPPASQMLNIGDTTNLSVVIDGDPPVSYQWLLNGTSIAGATGSSYTIAAAQPLNSGNYQVVAANPVGFTVSPVAAVTVTVPGGPTASAYYFSNRISFNPLVGPVLGNNTGANPAPEAGAPQFIDGKPYGRSIWYTWHASFDGVVSLTTRGSSFDTLLAVYTGTNVAELTPVAADDDSGGFFTSLVGFNCVAGTDYQIQVAGFQGAYGTVVLGLPSGTAYRVLNPTSGDALPVITQQPTNQLVQAGASATLTVTAFSSSPLTYQWFFQGAPVSGASSSKLVVANFQGGSVGNYNALVANSVGSVQSVNANLQLGGVPQAGMPADTTEDKFGDAVDLSQTDGGAAVLRLRPDDGGGDTGGFSASQTFSTVGATKEAGEPDNCGQVGGASEWYLYTTPVAGTLHIDTSGSLFNTILGVYTNSGSVAAFSNLVNQGCGFTTNYQKDGQPSVDLVGVPAKTTFYIVVDGYNGATGVAKLNIGLGAAPQIVTQPQSRPAVPGGSATFSVTAVGTTNLSYQWRFDSASIAGATGSSFTLTNAQTNAAGSYSVVVSNVVNTVTSAPAVLTLQSAPFILTPPANQAVNLGKTATFSVSAGGAAPLTYQWFVGGVPIAKATGSTLAVTATKLANEGNYTVVVSNSLGTTSTVANLTITESTAPTLRVLFPANNLVSTSPSVILRGTASDALGVTSVQLLINSNHLQTATGTTNWTNTVSLLPGTNHVSVQCFNLSDLASTPVNLTIIYIVTSPLTLQTNGSGKIIGQANQALLDVGRTYTLTATPGQNFLFSNWTGSNFVVVGTNHVLSFVMATNLFLQANFVTNPFQAVAGNYHGLFYPTNSVITEQNSGFVSLNLSPLQGNYTAAISQGGRNYAFTGGFGLTGSSQVTFNGPNKQPVTAELNISLNLTPPDNQITGTLSANGWQAALLADKAIFNGTTVKATNYAAHYTMAIPLAAGAPQSSPGGYGVATINNTTAGVASLVGTLGDGTAFNQVVPISENGVIPVYASLYTGQGSLLGWITFTNVPPQTLSGALNWIKPSGASKPLYPAGFTNQTTVEGSVYQAGGLILSNGTLTISGGAQVANLVYNSVTVSAGKLSYSAAGNPTNQLSASFNSSTGGMTLSFRPTGAKANLTATGVVLQSSTNAAGWFLGTNESGFFLLQP
jgi:choice-of-anchor C domain-containing protein